MPNFNLVIAEGIENPAFAIPAPEMEAAFSTEWIDELGPYQRALGVYSLMTMNDERKHVINRLVGNALMVGAHTPCTWSPTKGITNDVTEITPSPLSVQEEYCTEADWSAAFKLMRLIRNNEVTESSALVDAITQQIGYSVGSGLRYQAIAGGLKATEAVSTGVSADVNAMWLKARNAHTGLAKIMQTLGGKHDQNYFTATNVPATGFTGTFSEAYDTVLAGAHQKLRNAVNKRRITTRAGVLRPVVIVSAEVYNFAVAEENATAPLAAAQRRRLRHGFITASGERADAAGPGVIECLFIDEVPIVLEDSFSVADDITNTNTYFMAITVTKNINIGSSFANQSVLFGDIADAGLVVQQSTRVQDNGKISVSGKQLVSTAISDLDLLAGTVDVFTPA